MAKREARRAENVAGDFFVDDSCIDCDLCRAITPDVYARVGEMSAVVQQPRTPDETHEALKALVTCPTASIGTTSRQPTRAAAAAYPERVDGNVYFCGYAAESSFGASSYLIVREDGNVLVDSPRYASVLARGIDALGGVRYLFLTHRDDVADHERWAARYGAERILHADDVSAATRAVERQLRGDGAHDLAPDLTIIPTPGHTRGHACLLFDSSYLFTGDHVWWSPNRRALVASRSVSWYSWEEQLRSVERLLDYRFEWILPGHGRRHHAPVDDLHAELRAIVTNAALPQRE